MIVFVIAMASEAQCVLANMENVKERVACSKKVYEGTLCGQETAVIVTNVGKVNAACGAQYAIDILGADAIINIGVAGALKADMAVGEIYGISGAVQYDYDLAQLNGTCIGVLNEFSEAYLPLNTLPLYPLKKLGTGDRFNDSREDFLTLTQTLGADIRDMEGGAIAQVCTHAGVKYYSFKGISDVAGSSSTTEQYLANLKSCLEKLTGEIKKIFTGVENYL